MSLFIGSAPRLAEDTTRECRLPSWHYAHDALLAPNSSPGVGRFSFGDASRARAPLQEIGLVSRSAGAWKYASVGCSWERCAKTFVDPAHFIGHGVSRSMSALEKCSARAGSASICSYRLDAIDLEAVHALLGHYGRADRCDRPAWRVSLISEPGSMGCGASIDPGRGLHTASPDTIRYAPSPGLPASVMRLPRRNAMRSALRAISVNCRGRKLANRGTRSSGCDHLVDCHQHAPHTC